jgi:hypothetical protein
MLAPIFSYKLPIIFLAWFTEQKRPLLFIVERICFLTCLWSGFLSRHYILFRTFRWRFNITSAQRLQQKAGFLIWKNSFQFMSMHEPVVAKTVTRKTSQCTVRIYFAQSSLIKVLAKKGIKGKLRCSEKIQPPIFLKKRIKIFQYNGLRSLRESRNSFRL